MVSYMQFNCQTTWEHPFVYRLKCLDTSYYVLLSRYFWIWKYPAVIFNQQKFISLYIDSYKDTETNIVCFTLICTKQHGAPSLREECPAHKLLQWSLRSAVWNCSNWVNKVFLCCQQTGGSTFPLLPFRPCVLLKDWKPTHSLESDCVKVTSSSSKYWLSVRVQRHTAATLYKTKSSVLFCSCQRRRANTEAEWNRRVLLCGINKNVYLATA